MKIIWPVNRYSRCYADSSKQCLDAERRVAIFHYFSHLETQRAQSLGNYWSSINQTIEWSMFIEITTSAKGSCELSVRLKHDQNDIILEQFNFPESFSKKLKVSARLESIGFKYTVDDIFFVYEYECHLCYETICRFGLLAGHWTDPFQFLGPQWETQRVNQIESKPANEMPENFTEIATNAANISYGFPYQTPLSLPVNGEVAKTENEDPSFDPDVTQLDIDTGSLHLENSKSQKRQLVLGEEDVKQDIWSQIRINCEDDDDCSM